jgi:hypothetical protein
MKSMNSFRMTTIGVYACGGQEWEKKQPVVALVTPACPGLAIHKNIIGNCRGWALTHIPSGHNAGLAKDRREAKRVLIALSRSPVNWTLNKPALNERHKCLRATIDRAIVEARRPPIVQKQLDFGDEVSALRHYNGVLTPAMAAAWRVFCAP